MMRLDKFLCETGAGTRSEVKQFLKKGLVTVNGIKEKSADRKIDETKDTVTLRGEVLSFAKFHYYILHKPAGVITATEDNNQKTVMSLLKDVKDVSLSKLFPVGRLDKDTEGLLLITDDGELAHRLLSPKKHVEKTYQVHLRDALSPQALQKLETGVDIGDDTPTLPAKVKILEDKIIELSIIEGRYHQVKRMLLAVENEVTYLKRISMGGLDLPIDLEKGCFRALSEAEIALLKGEVVRNPLKNEKCVKMQNESAPDENPLKSKLFDFKAVIFDLDGTLVDSMWMWEKIDIEYLGRYGIPLPDKLQESIEGMSFSETAVYFKERFALADSLDKIKTDWNEMACEKYRNEVPFKEGALAFLQFCKKHGIKLGVATSNSRELVECVAEALDLHDYMDCIMTACEVKKGKPAPDIYLAVAKKLSVEPCECLVFEDILPGLQAGRNAGMTTCAIADAYSENVRTEKMESADYFIEDYRELL